MRLSLCCWAGCREAVSPSMGSQCRLIGTMMVVNFLDGLGRTQVIYTTLIALFLALPGPVIRGDQHRCGRTSAYAQFCSSKSN